MILAAGEEFPFVHRAPAGRDGDWLLRRQVVEEHVMLRLVEGERARVTDVGVEPGGQE